MNCVHVNVVFIFFLYQQNTYNIKYYVHPGNNIGTKNSETKKVLFAQNLNISKQSCNLCKKRIPKVVPSDIFIHSYAQKQYINAIGKFPPFTKPTSENNLIPASHQRVIS